MNRKFPSTRLRRLRLNQNILSLVEGTNLTKSDLIQPLFVQNSTTPKEEINKLPGQYRHNIDSLLSEVESLLESGINTIAVFPIVEQSKKNNEATEALNKENLISKAIKKIKSSYPEMILISDIALDPYTSHGHDGILKENYVDNDLTLQKLEEQSLLMADSGADILAPSDMMDGRIGVIRNALENSGFKNTILLSYAAKFNSVFYGPFRSAIKSDQNLEGASKHTYQLSYKNLNEALNEVSMDIYEGADIVMVKPGMPYLDVLKKIKDKFLIPTFVYQVSGEYTMLKNAIAEGVFDNKAIIESLYSFKRAGADAIITYFAKEVAEELCKYE